MLSRDELQSEGAYQVTMVYARRALEQGLISREDYSEFDTKMAEKYKPTYGQILADRPLLEERFRVIYSRRKEADGNENKKDRGP